MTLLVTPNFLTHLMNNNIFNKKYLMYWSILGLLVCDDLEAHSLDTQQFKNQLTGLAAFTWRSQELVANNEAYLIPGALLGGEALPDHKGATADELQLAGVLATDSNYYVIANLSAHRRETPDIENLYLVAPNISYLANINLEVGQLTTEVSEIANWHAPQSDFSEASLLADIFFGRHFSDVGLRLSRTFSALHLGVEVFNGESWPASTGQGSASLFAQWQFNFNLGQFNFNTWGMQSQAKNRSDTRYSGGHSHGGTIVTSPSTNYFFDGETNSFGALSELNVNLGEFNVVAQFEWIRAQSEGELFSVSQRSLYENDYEGYRVHFSVARNKHRLSVRHEQVALLNNFLSPVASLFPQEANLVNNTFEPTKTIVAWSYQLNSDVRLRLEGLSEKTVSEHSEDKFNLGIVWRRDFLK
ncbi:MAG: hypothetical protein KTR17_10890 [Cellvibrionaceae bacterium]|nr:hypothetical protein [Cellvibrionaceae bacterium]